LPPAEAMSCKCALAGYKSGAVPIFAEHMTTAMLAESGNQDELLKCVQYLLNDLNELKRISENGSEKIRKLLNWDDSVNLFEKLISEK
jgi:glycosyltransferase involved in cell wall biosynthesis